MLIFILPLKSHFKKKQPSRNEYSVVSFSLTDKNNKNTGNCDNKQEQHPELTNYMKRNILLVDETLI